MEDKNNVLVKVELQPSDMIKLIEIYKSITTEEDVEAEIDVEGFSRAIRVCIRNYQFQFVQVNASELAICPICGIPDDDHIVCDNGDLQCPRQSPDF